MNPVGSRALALAKLNLRRTRRLRVRQQAKIVFGAETMIHCEVRDLSVGGARISLKQHVSLPERFELFICAQDLRVHTVRVCWREGDFIGVSFGADEANEPSVALSLPHQFAAQSYPALAASNAVEPVSQGGVQSPAVVERVRSTPVRPSVRLGSQGWERRRLSSRRSII
jgi:hypothetical protein